MTKNQQILDYIFNEIFNEKLDIKFIPLILLSFFLSSANFYLLCI